MKDLKPAKDPYAHRKHRVKYQEGYGAEGAARGASHLGEIKEGRSYKGESPKEKSYSAEKDSGRKKTRPDPY